MQRCILSVSSPCYFLLSPQISRTPALVDFSSISDLPPHDPRNLEICATGNVAFFIIDGVLYATGNGQYFGTGSSTPNSDVPVLVNDTNVVSDMRCRSMITPLSSGGGMCAKYDTVLKWYALEGGLDSLGESVPPSSFLSWSSN